MHEPDYLKNFEHLEYDAKVQEAEVCREDAIGFKPGSVLLRLQEITSEKNLQDLRTLIEEASKEGITPQMIAAEIERELKTELESGVIHNAKSSLREAQEAGLTISFVPETYTSQAQKQLDDLIVSRDGNPSGALYYIRDAEELGIKITIRDESIPMIEKYVEKLLVDQHVNPDKPYELLQEMKPYVSGEQILEMLQRIHDTESAKQSSGTMLNMLYKAHKEGYPVRITVECVEKVKRDIQSELSVLFYGNSIDLEKRLGYINYKMEIASKAGGVIDLEEIFKETLGADCPFGITFAEIKRLCKASGAGKYLVRSLHKLSSYDYQSEIVPMIAAQGDAAHMYFNNLQEMNSPGRSFPLTEDERAFTVTIAKKYNTTGRNILENIIMQLGHFEADIPMLKKYLDEIGISDFSLYQQYKGMIEEGKDTARLKEGIARVQNTIYEGKDVDYGDPLYPAILYHVFPPAMGITQNDYAYLLNSRPDRRNDVPGALDELQHEEIKVTTGKYEVANGETLKLDIWDDLSATIEEVNTKREEMSESAPEASVIGKKLVEFYQQQITPTNRKELFLLMYRYHLKKGGGVLPNNYAVNIEGLMEYKEFIADTVKNDLIRECILAYKSENEEVFAALVEDIKNRFRGKNKPPMVAKVISMRKQIQKTNDERAVKKLNEILSQFGTTYEEIRDLPESTIEEQLSMITVNYQGDDTGEEYFNSKEFIEAYDLFYERQNPDKFAISKISTALLGEMQRDMEHELGKFTFEAKEGASVDRTLEFIISKKREHGAAGYNMGVCVTPDKVLWDDPTFMNCIIFDKETRQACGGMHFLVREDCLCLPGINPSLSLLSVVDNEHLYDQMIAYAKKVQHSLGLQKLYIPKDPKICSNRTQFQNLIERKSYPSALLEEVAVFATEKPYEYSFQDCYEVE